MKKLFFTLLLITSVFALSAQGFNFSVTDVNGNTIENGANYYIYGTGGDDGELVFDFLVTANEGLRIIGEKVEVQGVVENTENYFCFAGQCLPSNIYVTQPYEMSAGHVEDFAAHYMYVYPASLEDVAGLEQVMQYYLYPANDPDNKFIVNVVFKFSLESIEDYNSPEVFSNAYPVPAYDVVNFDYNFATNVNAEVAIYNMMGQEVLRNSIDGMSGKASINVSDLADGVYFYSLIVNGKTEKSSKLVIRK